MQPQSDVEDEISRSNVESKHTDLSQLGAKLFTRNALGHAFIHVNPGMADPDDDVDPLAGQLVDATLNVRSVVVDVHSGAGAGVGGSLGCGPSHKSNLGWGPVSSEKER